MLYYPYFVTAECNARRADDVVILDGKTMGPAFRGYVSEVAVTRDSEGEWLLHRSRPRFHGNSWKGKINTIWAGQDNEESDSIGYSEDWVFPPPGSLREALKCIDEDKESELRITYDGDGLALPAKSILIILEGA